MSAPYENDDKLGQSAIVLSEKSGGENYGFKISAGKGGVGVCADSIKFAVIFLGSPLPKQPVFKLIFKPGSRTLQMFPSREEGFLKLMVWPFNGAKGLIAQNPAKVCAITRKLYKNLSRDFVQTAHTQMSETAMGN